jgi:hypothetical protein
VTSRTYSTVAKSCVDPPRRVEEGRSLSAQRRQACSARCPHCGALNTFPGFSAIEAFILFHVGHQLLPLRRLPELKRLLKPPGHEASWDGL